MALTDMKLKPSTKIMMMGSREEELVLRICIKVYEMYPLLFLYRLCQTSVTVQWDSNDL